MKKSIALLIGLSATRAIVQSAPPLVNHDFDFWIGEWSVTTPDGQIAGNSRVEPIAGGRGLYENWEGAPGPTGQPGGSGKSLNALNVAKNKWQQFWVGSGGNVLELSGGLVEGRMVLTGGHALQDGRAVIDRITWTPNADRSVQQHWEQSFDEGKTWKTVFDGHYTKKQ